MKMVKLLMFFMLLFSLNYQVAMVVGKVTTKGSQIFCTRTLNLGDNETKPLGTEDENVINELLQCSSSQSQTAVTSTPNPCHIQSSDSVTCDCNLDKAFCRVIEIAFSSRNIEGILPEKIGNLKYLRSLVLSENKFLGQIPTSFAKLKSLKHLNLEDNKLEGPIPPFLGDMKSLEFLDLSGNSLNGSIPIQLGSLVNLTYLDLSSNLLRGSIPNQLDSIVNLNSLDLSKNLFEGSIPTHLCSLVNLMGLYLYQNLFNGSIPSELRTLVKLTYLSLGDNKLSGPLPKQLGELSLLEYLDLGDNKLSGPLPDELGQLSRLKYLDVRGNNLTGQIPDYIGNLVHLRQLILMGNNFSGPLPREISKLTNLQVLIVSNLVEGESQFPDFSKMGSLEYLTLSKCFLSDRIPEIIWNLPSLYYLDLSFNSLFGEIPKDFSSLKLEYIFLRENKLNGTIPTWMMNSTKYIDVSENIFTNNVTEITDLKSNSSNLNFFSCLNSSNTATHWEQANYSCSNKKQLSDNLYINCGGGSMSINGSYYDADLNSNGSSTFFINGSSSWGYSSMGSFIFSAANDKYTMNNTCIAGVGDTLLYSTARVSPISLKYYGFCLKNDVYTVKLHFAELVSDAYKSPNINKSRRVFDVDIQGNNEVKNLNIAKKAGGVNQAYIVERNNVTVKNNRLEIHLYWSGKGSVDFPSENYGPLISAISAYPYRESGMSPLTMAAISLSVLLVLIVLIVYFWKMEDKSHEDLSGLVELYPGGLYNFQKIKAAADNFKQERGKGGFGTFYEATLGNGIVVAVEKVSATKDIVRAFREKDSTISVMEHPNFVKLMGCIAEKNQLLLVYEDIGNSLQNALFDSNRTLDWPTRYKICLGIAEGLASLHECKQHNVHGNIKPACIFLDKHDNAKISDLGFAKLHDKGKLLVDGTAIYVAPEYFKSRAVITPKVDVYSFGALMLVVVSGENEMTISTSGGESITEYLPDKAVREMRQGNYMRLVDKSLCNKVDWDEAETILELAMLCLDQYPDQRPKMSQVVEVLKKELKLEVLKERLKQPTSGRDHEPRGEISIAEEDTTLAIRNPGALQGAG